MSIIIIVIFTLIQVNINLIITNNIFLIILIIMDNHLGTGLASLLSATPSLFLRAANGEASGLIEMDLVSI